MTLDQIMSGIEERDAKSFAQSLAQLEKYEADPVILKSELAQLRSYGVNRGFEAVWDRFIDDVFVVRGKWESLSPEEQKLKHGFYSPQVHTVAGMLKRVQAARAAEGALRTKMIEVLEFMVPIAARTDALKTKIGQRQPATTKTSIEQAERDAKAMTCQVCDRGILAETGCIAHHGYTRPGTGYQTNSCEGARAVPLEISRDGLGHHIKRIKTDIQSKLQWQDDVENERIGISWSMEDRTQCTRMYETGRTVIRTVKRETFDQVKQDTAALRKGKQESVTFDTLKARLMKDNLTTIDVLRRYLAQQEGRYNAWVGPTHEWNETNKTWSMLDMAAMSPAAQQKMADKLKTMQFDQPVAVPTDPDGMPAAATPETSAGMPTPTRRRMR